MEANAMKCPRCGWESSTKVASRSSNVVVITDWFACMNPECGVQRIYGEGGLMLIMEKDEKKEEEQDM